MTLHDVLNPGVEGEHKFPPHSGKQMIFLLQINLIVMEVYSGGVGARESLDVLEGEEVLLQCR